MDLKNSEFRKSLKYETDYDMVKLLSIQRKIEANRNDEQIISKLISSLTKSEKDKLIQLYNSQILFLNNSINNYKNKIIKERKKCS
jgi:hypothetical protein